LEQWKKGKGADKKERNKNEREINTLFKLKDEL